MSPAPARISDAAMLAVARALLEEGGEAAVTMQAVAARLGVRAPSLYKRVVDRAALLRAVAHVILDDLGVCLATAAAGSADPAERLRVMAHAFRAFAHASPQGHAILFGALPPGERPDAASGGAAIEPVLAAARELAGAERALAAARTLTAFVHGFTAMESAGMFGLGGDVDAAFAFGVDVLIEGLSRA